MHLLLGVGRLRSVSWQVDVSEGGKGAHTPDLYPLFVVWLCEAPRHAAVGCAGRAWVLSYLIQPAVCSRFTVPWPSRKETSWQVVHLPGEPAPCLIRLGP
jgi:hypothetical protein